MGGEGVSFLKLEAMGSGIPPQRRKDAEISAEKQKQGKGWEQDLPDAPHPIEWYILKTHMERGRWQNWLLISVAIATSALRAQTAPGAASSGTPLAGVPDLKLFEAAVSLANTLTSWAFVMIGGSILTILGTSYYRPAALWVRCSYLAFVPAWFFLAWSIYAGTRVQGVYLAALYSAHPNVVALKISVNDDAISQIQRMEIGLACFGVWLTLYLLWWIFHKETGKGET